MRDQFEVNPINHHPISLQQSHPDVELFSQSINPSMIKISWSLRSFQNQSIPLRNQSFLLLSDVLRAADQTILDVVEVRDVLVQQHFHVKRVEKLSERKRELAQSKTFQSIPNERLSYQQSISQSPITVLLLKKTRRSNKQTKVAAQIMSSGKIKTSCFKFKNVQTFLPNPNEPTCPVKHLGREFVLICD